MITATFGIEKESLADLLHEAEHGKAQLPDFQRGWVWDDAHVRALLASSSLSYPIGTVMLLRAGGEASDSSSDRSKGRHHLGRNAPSDLEGDAA